MDLLPIHLKGIAENCVYKNHSIIFDIKCSCGNNLFEIKKARTNHGKEEEKKWNQYWRKFRFLPIFSFNGTTEKKSGRYYTYGSTWFGIPVGKYYLDGRDFIDYCIVKAICPSCGKEHILLDSRKNGYDALAEYYDSKEFAEKNGTKKSNTEDENAFSFRKLGRNVNPFAVKIKIINDLDLNEFYETFGSNASEEEYSNAFARIVIYSVLDGKNKPIFEMETS